MRHGRPWAACALAATAALALSLLGAGAPAASADEEQPASTANAITAIGSITAPADGAFIPRNTVTVAGEKAAGSTVEVAVTGGGPRPPAAGCLAPADQLPGTTWSCEVTLPNGPNVTVTATETATDSSTSASAVIVHVLGPPTIAATPPQDSPGVASGTGYPDAKIRLYVAAEGQSAIEQDCTALVAGNGEWECTIANGPGTYTVSASQVHPGVGNPPGTSVASRSVTLEVRAVEPPDEPTPAPGPAPQPVPVRPAPAPPPPVEPEPVPSPEPTQQSRDDAASLPWLDRPVFPGPSGKGTPVREALTNWGTPTDFGARLPTLSQTVTGGSWAWAPLMALLFIGFVALPLRLLVTALRGRNPFRRMRLTGRNRASTPSEEPVARNPWVVGAVPLAATAALIVLAEGLNGEVRYLRLLFSVGLGLAILNVVGVAIVTRLAAPAAGIRSRLKFLPVLLIAAAIATLLSRVTGIEPPLVGGVLIGAGFALSVPARPRALVNLSQVAAVLAIAVLGWVGHELLGPPDGFWPGIASETLAALCLAGIGSALMLMLPLGALPGRSIVEWSPAGWFLSTLAVATIAAVVLLGGTPATFPMLTSAVIVVGFAAICVAVWAWANYARESRA